MDEIASEEGGGFLALRGGEEGFGVGDFEDLPGDHQSGAVSQSTCLEDVVGDENDCGSPLGVLGLDDVFDEADVVWIEISGRFVEEKD